MNKQLVEKAPSFQGFLKIWKTHKETGKSELLVDKKNMVLYQGADLLAYSLAGYANAKISHMYFGFMNSATLPTPSKVIDKAYSVPFDGYTTPYGVLRLPLTFPTQYLADTNYDHNIAVFTTMITTATAEWGDTFQSSSPYSWVFEVATIAALDPATHNDDVVFSRVQFSPIKYEATYNLTVSWGIKFLAV